MAWYWELPVCWECTHCGTISYGSRQWLRKTPPVSCPHCGQRSFTGIGTHNRPLTWSLPARGSRTQQYTRIFGWFLVATGAASALVAVLPGNTRHVPVLDPNTLLPILLGMAIAGPVLGVLVHRGIKTAWVAGSLSVIGGLGFGVWASKTLTWWVVAAWFCWWVIGLVLAWKSAFVLRRQPA